ncbi:glycine reductase [Alphaproteobacteria bacterium]|nr:glycine reductase [Alphaproteobacteria bacterium]
MQDNPPLPYMERIRNYYQILGYGAPYEWAQHDDVPFASPQKPLSEMRIGIVTTAAPFQPGKGDQGPGAPYNGAPKFFQVYADAIDPFPDLRIAHIAIDRAHTTASDIASYFPLTALVKLATAGYIGSVSPRFYGLPTNRSKRTTRDIDSKALLAFCQEDHVDAVVLVPNCPVCHQSVALAAHCLETAGIATVIMGCAKDIIEHIGVPRLLFNDLPLGNAAGLPDDPAAQDLVAQLAVDMLFEAAAPRSTKQSPLIWSGAADWKKDYSNAALLSADEIAERRAEFDRVKAAASAIKSASKTSSSS